MHCSICHKSVPDGSTFCPHCGARLEAEASTAKPRKSKVGKVILWIVLGLVLVYFGSMGIFSLRGERVTEQDLDEMVQNVRDGAEDIIEFMDPVVLSLGDQGYVDLSDIDTRMEAIGQSHSYGYIASNIRSLMNRRGWKSDKYEEYEELFEAYEALYDFMDGIFSEDRAYDLLYSRRLVEETGLPFFYYYDDAQTLRTQYESLVQTYRKCLKRIP